MKCLKRSMLAGMLSTMFTVVLLTSGVARATSMTCGTVSVVSSPNIGSDSNYLGSVAAVSANDIWAVGDFVNDNVFPIVVQTLTEHWNGTSWSVVSSPNVGSNNSNYLSSAAAVSANDIWAVGFSHNNDSSINQTLIENWNGRRWNVVKSPNAGTFTNQLFSVAAVSANDIWAVGSYTASSRIIQTLIEHWDGTSWSVVSSPNPDPFANVLTSVAAVSATDVWAVGERNGPTLIEHWNGTNWSVVPSPSVGSGNNYLYGIAVASANDIWTVGFHQNASKVLQTLIEHWNGTSWNVVKSPNVGSGNNYLYSVAVISANNVWAVGNNASSSGFYPTLIEHWNGTSWSVVPSPSPGTQYNELHGVTAISNNIWMVGYATNTGGNQRTLTEFDC